LIFTVTARALSVKESKNAVLRGNMGSTVTVVGADECKGSSVAGTETKVPKLELAVLQVRVCAGEWAEAGMGQSGAGVDDGEACGVAGEERVKMSSRSEGSVAEESGNGIRGGIDIRSVDMVIRGRSASCTGSKKNLTDRRVRSEQVTKV